MAGKKDQILIEGIIRQNEKVIAEVYKEFFPSVRQFIYRNRGSSEDARDIFNDAIMVVVLKGRENKLVLKCSLKTYVYAISRNLWLKKLKSEKLEMIRYEEIEDSMMGAEIMEEEEFDEVRAKLLYQKHLMRISTTCQQLIENFLEGKTYKEIVEEMNLDNESYARKRKYRCIKILIKRIKSDPDYKSIYPDD
jgi:RNA polymerase sigma factor (sigma-70 family)